MLGFKAKLHTWLFESPGNVTSLCASQFLMYEMGIATASSYGVALSIV